MSTHLLALALGPVQDFISAARRTRDLWFGSFLLSEISKAVALSVKKAGAELIFPAPKKDADLQPESAFNVANVILAELPVNLIPQGVSQTARRAAQTCWQEYAGRAEAYVCPAGAEALVDREIWQEQLGDVIEFYAAWVPFSSPDGYREARTQVMRLLAARKACRDFRAAYGRSGVPKSSLDGARESVLVLGETRNETRQKRRHILHQDQELAQRLRLSGGEELDIVGVTKRAAEKESFPSITRVAADAWIRGIKSHPELGAFQLLSFIEDKCKRKNAAFVTGTGKKYYRDSFPYDGAFLYPERLQKMLRKPVDESSEDGELEDFLSDDDRYDLVLIQKWLTDIERGTETEPGYDPPDSYLAVLVADGDYMGKAISAIGSADKHREFSQQLAQFASAADTIVQENSGCLVYSGGDDVLALVPVDTCVTCARQLHDQFGKLMDTWKGEEGQSLTLSVGIAIGHRLTPMEDLLNYGRAAEKEAKKPNRNGLAEKEAKDLERNGLAVHLHPRGGAPITIREQWPQDPNDDNGLDSRMQDWADLHLRNQIPDKAGYDLRQLTLAYEAWPQNTDKEKKTLADAFSKDALRLIKKKKGGLGDEGLEKLTQLLAPATSAKKARQLADEVIIARRIATVKKQAEGRQQSSSQASSQGESE